MGLGYGRDMEYLISLIAEKCADNRGAAVALSGGVDSGLVAAAAFKALGEQSLAVTIQSQLTPLRDAERAAEVAQSIGINHKIIELDILQNKDVVANPQNRCYYCKRAVFGAIVRDCGPDCLVMDGTNADDDPARPGLKAVAELKVFSPLLEAGLTKAQVRELAKLNGLPNWDTPSESCLATRIPVGSPLTADGLSKVETMETFFHLRGVTTLRVTHDNLVATVSYLPQYAQIMNENRDKFVALIKEIGLRSCEFKEWTE